MEHHLLLRFLDVKKEPNNLKCSKYPGPNTKKIFCLKLRNPGNFIIFQSGSGLNNRTFNFFHREKSRTFAISL